MTSRAAASCIGTNSIEEYGEFGKWVIEKRLGFSITKLQIYPITKLKKNPGREKIAGRFGNQRELKHEGSGISKKDL